MATETSSLHLVKPTAEEHPSQADLNGNYDKIDAGYAALKANLLSTYQALRAYYNTHSNADLTAILDQAILDLNTNG